MFSNNYFTHQRLNSVDLEPSIYVTVVTETTPNKTANICHRPDGQKRQAPELTDITGTVPGNSQLISAPIGGTSFHHPLPIRKRLGGFLSDAVDATSTRL